MSNKVTYNEIIEALSRTTGFSKNKGEAFAKALIAEIKDELQKNGKASITNFGSFKVKDVAERQGQNPQTGEPITIPAHKRVTFTPYKALREEVNKKYAHLESELIGEKKEKAAPVIQEKAEAVQRETPDVEPEKVAEEEPKSFHRKERVRGNNTGLIMVAVLVLVIVTLASAWFLTRTNDTEQTAVSEPVQTEQQAMTSDQPEADESANDLDNRADELIEEEERLRQEEEERLARLEDAREDQQPEQTPVAQNISDYQVQQDEWYWVISRKVYGKSEFWPLIFQQNFSKDRHPDSLETRTNLEVPALMGSAENLTKEDYKNLSSASALVSLAYKNFGRDDKAEDYARFAKKWERLSQ
ncbi:MAG: HU family DNA-binding protein [Gracilimonas sp.]